MRAFGNSFSPLNTTDITFDGLGESASTTAITCPNHSLRAFRFRGDFLWNSKNKKYRISERRLQNKLNCKDTQLTFKPGIHNAVIMLCLPVTLKMGQHHRRVLCKKNRRCQVCDCIWNYPPPPPPPRNEASLSLLLFQHPRDFAMKFILSKVVRDSQTVQHSSKDLAQRETVNVASSWLGSTHIARHPPTITETHMIFHARQTTEDM